MSTVINHSVVARRLTPGRLRSYLAATGNDVVRAIELYDWNMEIGGALYEDIGRLEVVFRNALDSALLDLGDRRHWPTVWYQRTQLFRGDRGLRARDDIAVARQRATRFGKPELHGKVIAELTMGFWRYLCATQHLTTLWVPALGGAFPLHPRPADPFAIRKDVNDRMQRLHFLRNRIAHYEPIHRRNLGRDHDNLTEVVGWICPDSRAWIGAVSRTPGVLAQRPTATVARSE